MFLKRIACIALINFFVLNCVAQETRPLKVLHIGFAKAREYLVAQNLFNEN